MQKTNFIFLLALGLWLLAFSANATEVKEASETGVKSWYVEDKSLPIISIKLAFKNSGYAYDKTSGLAYAAASMMNEGAGNRDSKAFQKALEDNAIDYSADVDADNFYITIRTLSRNLDLTLDLLNDSLTKLHAKSDDFERVRGQIISLIAKRDETPSKVASEKFFQTIFAGHPYANYKQGQIATINKIRNTEILDYTKRNFAKNNLVISIVGDVDKGRVKYIMKKITAHLPKNNSFEPLPEFKRYPATKISNTAIPNPQTAIMFGFEGIKRQDKDFITAFLLSHIIGGDGFQARLVKEVREKRGLAYSIGTDMLDMDEGSVFYGSAGTESVKAGQTIAIIRAEISKAVNGITEAELEDAKKYVIGSFPLNLDSNSRIASFVMTIQLEGLGIDYLEKRKSLIESVTLADANRVAKRLFKPDNLVFVTVGK